MKFLILSMALLAIFTASAQNIYFSEKVGWRKSGLELHTFSDITQTRHCSVLAGDDSIRVYIFEGDSLKREMGLIRLNREKVKGGFFLDGQVHLVLEASSPKGYHWWHIPLDSEKNSETFYEFNPHKQKILDQYSAGDRFLVFTTEKKDQSFHIWSFAGKEEPDTMSCVFADRTWYFLTKANGFGRTLNIAKMDFFGNGTAEIASRPNKLYYRTDSLFLVMDGDGRSLIFRFDLRNRNLTKFTIRHHEPSTDMTENSYLLNNYLYYVNASEDSLSVEVNDFYTGARLRSYRTGKKDTLYFKNTSIRQEGLEAFYGLGSKELDRARQLMRKMKNGEPFIDAVQQDSGSVALSIGSYKEVQRMSGGGFYATPGIAGAAPVYVSSGFYRSSFEKTTHYGMELTNGGLDFREGKMDPAINEQIDQFTDGIKISSSCENLFHNGNRYRYAYYDNQERKLLMVQF